MFLAYRPFIVGATRANDAFEASEEGVESRVVEEGPTLLKESRVQLALST